MLVLGIDDSGRGPVLGPMILAGCLMTEEVEKELKIQGVKDSKELTQRRREHFEKIIKEKIINFKVEIVTPDEIDNFNYEGTKLNEVEGLMAVKIINKLNNGKEKIRVLIDCPSISIAKWTDFLRMRVKNLSNLELVCKHKADRDHPCVSAGSILAKCERERQMDKLRKEYPRAGSGYPSDPATLAFLEKYALKYKNKGIFRKTWITWKKAAKTLEQEKLF